MAEDRRGSDIVVKIGVLIETVSELTVRIGLVLLCLGLLYVLFGVFSKQLFNLQGADVARVAANLNNITQYMLVIALVVCLVLVFRQKEDTQELYGIIAVTGALMWFGFPFLVRFMSDMTPNPENEAVVVTVSSFARTGQVVLATLAWPIAVFVYRRIRFRPLRKQQDEMVDQSGLRRERPKHAPRVRPTFLSPCWHLPYCRDYLVEACPAFIARKRCWKFGGGCFCDQGMIEAMLVGMNRSGRRPGAAYMRAEIEARQSIYRQRRDRRTPCKTCFIYLEHEKLKYEVMNVLVYPLTAAAIYFGYEPVIRRGWLAVHGTIEHLWRSLAFSSAPEPTSMSEVFGMETVIIMVAILLGMWLLLGLLKFCELWCFKWKL